MTSSPRQDVHGVDLDKDDVFQVEYDWSNISPSTAVAETIAVVVDRDPTSLDPLYEWVEPDALDSIMSSNEAGSTDQNIVISFTFYDLSITVDAQGEVVVRPRDSL